MVGGDLREMQQPLVDRMRPGAPVLVWCRFNECWVEGFSIDSRSGATYRLVRDCDGAVLPADFDEVDLTAAH